MVAEAIFIFLSPFVLLILASWLRKYEIGWYKISLNIVICFNVLLLSWYAYGMFTEKTVGGSQHIPPDYFEHPEKYPDILLNKKP